MATTSLGSVLQRLRRSIDCREEAGSTDCQLLDAYIARRDASSFEAIVRRRGPMVLGVCLRILQNEADAEDAFQATFLVLVRKATTIRPRTMLGNWLYGVAQSTALKARAMRTKRSAKERWAAASIESQNNTESSDRLLALLDQELKALPDKYRAAIVLCDLSGASIKEAAQQLGCPPATVGTRLARGRRLLARRVSRRGLALSINMVAATVAQQASAATVPTRLLASTVEAARLYGPGRALATGAISARILALTEGALKNMLLTKLKIATACCLIVSVLAAGTSVLSYSAAAARGQAPPAPVAASTEHSEEPQAPDSKTKTDKPAVAGPAVTEVHGSGKVITKELPLTDFTSVEVSRSIQIELTQADSYRVTITSDDNIIPHVQALKDGSALRIFIDPKLSFWATALKATIAMPMLNRINVASGGRVTVKGFKSDTPFQARIGPSGILHGELEVPSADLDVASGSRVTLKGSAKEIKIAAAQACRVSLGDFPVENANVTLRDGASATVNVKQKLTYDLARACRLSYMGKPLSTKGTMADGSTSLPVISDPDKEHSELVPKPAHQHHQGGADSTLAAVAVGAKVPDFPLRDLDGRAVKFSELQKDAKRTPKGVVVLCFWCSTCGSCRRVEKDLDKLAKEYEGKALVLALDANAGETPEGIRAAATKAGIQLPILLSPNGQAADLFGTEVTTTTVVIDGDGVLRYCGRFSAGGGHAYAEDALKAVLAGEEITVKTTPHDGCKIVRK